MSRRRVAGTVPQGTDEEVAYKFDFRNFVEDYGAPTSEGACTLYDITDGTEDVSATKLTGAASLSGNVVTSKIVTGLLDGHRYRLTQAAGFTGGLTFSGYVVIDGET